MSNPSPLHHHERAFIRAWLIGGALTKRPWGLNNSTNDILRFRGDAAMIMHNGSVQGVVDHDTVFVHRYVALLVGLPDFSIEYVVSPRIPSGVGMEAIVCGKRHTYRQSFELIPPMSLLAWRAEQTINAQQPIPLP